ncbi:hypothetical protein ACB092_11G097900 [Castanea dentata]
MKGLAVFCFLVWIERSVLLVHEVSVNKISGSTEGVDGSNISIFGFYLLKEDTLLIFCRLTQKDGEEFASGKISNMIRSDAKQRKISWNF